MAVMTLSSSVAISKYGSAKHTAAVFHTPIQRENEIAE